MDEQKVGGGEQSAVQISEEQAKAIVVKLRIPSGWKKEISEKYHMGTEAELLTIVDAVIDKKARVKATGDATKTAEFLQKMKEDKKAIARKVITKVLSAKKV